jgi:hypothetical protein
MGRCATAWLAAGSLLGAAGLLACVRAWARNRRRHGRVVVVPYRTDRATPETAVAMFEALHAAVLQRWWRRLFAGQGSVALELHALPGAGPPMPLLALSCPVAARARVEAAVRIAYPNTAFERFPVNVARAPAVVRLKKRGLFVTQIRVADPRRPGDPPVDRVIDAMAAAGRPAVVQVALTPVPALFELYSRWLYRGRERRASDARDRGERRPPRDRSEVDGAELRGGLDVQHRPLFFADVRVVGRARRVRRSPRRSTPRAPRTDSSSAGRRFARCSSGSTTAAWRAARTPRCRRGRRAYTRRPSFRRSGSLRPSISRRCRSRAGRCRACRPGRRSPVRGWARGCRSTRTAR